MPAAMTFNSLKGDIARYLERANNATSDPLVYAQLPSLINLAERRIAHDLKIQGIQETVVGTFDTGVATYAKPDRWRQTISFNYGTGTGNRTRNQIFPRVYEYLLFYWPDDSQVAKPLFYADYDAQHWKFAPTPDGVYPFECLYYQLPVLLDDTTQTNWLTEYLPDCLLYASLFETAAYIKNGEEMGKWKGFYDDSKASIKAEDMGKIVDRTSTRTGA
ncbi:hypothetical protein UFOVP1204_18 [uncultured Caudovirales phage]|uniref:Uncharacterized protein n=1 Tax=uncultured Caudovirales phage TaxID=2100421 RepID=A0A6J5PWH2_9CAUD|nr:hypothetical protein UFOVP473_9 [uncultured Caudovirales phage]CAB4176219.1 hypothetical protein UFOVP983_9 [uncultured Caudovirales phage]CAB4189655.1 hypothetical protein UFOVP1204_18 [uncultured Caudovirales phage]